MAANRDGKGVCAEGNSKKPPPWKTSSFILCRKNHTYLGNVDKV